MRRNFFSVCYVGGLNLSLHLCSILTFVTLGLSPGSKDGKTEISKFRLHIKLSTSNPETQPTLLPPSEISAKPSARPLQAQPSPCALLRKRRFEPHAIRRDTHRRPPLLSRAQ